MIFLQEQLPPPVTVSFVEYVQPAKISWLHAEHRDLISEDQIRPSTGPASVIPTAIFSIEEYLWSGVEW